jgi:hypothetical protein
MANATSDTLQNAAASAKDQISQQKDGAAASLGSFAGALRKAAHESGGDGSAAHMADWAADGLERVSQTLRSNDLNGMMRQVESFARSQPVAFFFAAAAAGFLATRFLKAGAPASQGDGGSIAGSMGGGLRRDAGSFESSGGAIGKTDVSSTVPF